MDSFLPVIVVLAVLGSLVVAFFSFKTWRIFPVILVVLILLATLPFYYLAARTLRTHQAWRSLIKTQEAEIAKLEVENEDYREGAPKKDPQLVGIRDLRVQLHDIMRDRGEVWRGVTPEKVDENGAVEASVKEPDPSGIEPKMVLFAFDEPTAERAGRFLGEFKVSESSGKSLKMEPNLPLDETGMTLLKQSRGPWSLYAKMPIDDPKVYASLSAADKTRMLPAESIAELDKDWKLRDYTFLFWKSHEQDLLIDDTIAKQKKTIEDMDLAIKQAQDDVKYRKAEQAALTADRNRFLTETKLVADHWQRLKEQYDALRATLKATFLENHKLAGEIARMQLKAAEAIDLRTAEQVKADRPQTVPQP